jgi:hypothetical protein
MKECDRRNGHINNELHMIYIASNNDKHPVTKLSLYLITLHPTTLHSTSLQYSTLYVNNYMFV